MKTKKIFLFLLFTFKLTLGLGEKVPFSLLRKLLPANPVILEAGAQFGEDTQWMSDFWSAGIIHAFEPLPESFAQLKQVASTRNNIQIYNLALAAKNGPAAFYVAGGASSLLPPTPSFNQDYFHADLEHPITVHCITLDDWARNNTIDHIDFMWLDMEGNELIALKAGDHILSAVKVIYTEVNLQNFWQGTVLYQDLKEYLEQKGFTEIWKDIVPHWHGNALFVRD